MRRRERREARNGDAKRARDDRYLANPATAG